VNVTGASPSTQETAELNLWTGRSPTAAASGAVGTLAQTWVDNSQTGSSGQTFGAMSAITAGGQNVTASVVNSTEVQVSFTPERQRLVPGGHRGAQVDRRQRGHHRLDPDRRGRHRRRDVAASNPVLLVERVLGERRAGRGDLF